MSRRRPSRIHGLLPVYKLAGPTSHDVVDMARRALGERRIGHTGTLDPMAEGLLLLCVGHATRLQQFLMRWEKTYRGVVQLGHATTTYDREGERSEPRGPVPALEPELLARLTARFRGEIQQVPPPYSAKKVAGRKMYELARDGQDIDLEAKPVTVHGLRLEAAAADRLELEVTTSSGFYVRSLAHDLGCELGCGGHLYELQRTRIGPYLVTAALTQGALEPGAEAAILGGSHWVPLDAIELPLPTVELNRGTTERFVHGQDVVVLRAGGDPLEVEGEVVVHSDSLGLLGVGVVQSVLARGRTVGLRPSVVLAGL